MSKLIQKLNQAYGQSSSLGFGSSLSKVEKMVTVALCSSDGKVKEVKGCVDSIIFPSGFIPSSLPEIPWGIFLPSEREVGGAMKKGGDFVIVGAETSMVVAEEEIGKIMLLDFDLPNSFIWSSNFLPIEGVALKMDESPQNFSHLATIERFMALVQKPLLLFLPSLPSTPELKVLWKAGIEGIMVSQFSKAGFEELNRITLPPRRKGRVYASLGESLTNLGAGEQ
jgi:hypothetical protein